MQYTVRHQFWIKQENNQTVNIAHFWKHFSIEQRATNSAKRTPARATTDQLNETAVAAEGRNSSVQVSRSSGNTGQAEARYSPVLPALSVVVGHRVRKLTGDLPQNEKVDRFWRLLGSWKQIKYFGWLRIWEASVVRKDSQKRRIKIAGLLTSSVSEGNQILPWRSKIALWRS